MDQRRTIMLALLVLVVGSLLLVVLLPDGVDAPRERGQAIGVVNIQGVITEGAAGLLGAEGASARAIQDQLRRAGEDRTVRAVVVRINSLGGSAAASQEVAVELARLRDTGKPVVVSMGDAGVSGAYWVASAADEIMVSPATVTGSIGVIFQTTQLMGLYELLGIEVEVIQSGPFKDTGAPHRELREDERELIQAMVDDMFDQFVDAVAAGRGMDRDQVLALADGRVFTGRQAHEVGLVDSFGNFNDAGERAAELAGLDDYRLVPMAEPSFLDRLIGPLSRAIAQGLRAGLGLSDVAGGIQP